MAGDAPPPGALTIRPLAPEVWEVSGCGVTRRCATLEGARRWAALHLSDCGGGHVTLLDAAGQAVDDLPVGSGSLAVPSRRGG
ncbi:hypothetical protein [Pedococcus aerophilus]|uniref:hypothetical protein n=1 Tax=Pedococcus aerophilus TaxID=436356 RepID=UPI0031DD2A2C